MSEVHNADIRELLDTIPAMPKALMIEYLMRQYEITRNLANEALYNATRNGPNHRPSCYVSGDGGYILKADYVTMTSKIKARCDAFRVACEFLPEGRNFSIPRLAPWLLSFFFDGTVYYVAEFEPGKELIVSDMIRSAGIGKDMVPVTNRIGILAPGANRDLLDGCGIRYFCTIDRDYRLTVTEEVEEGEIWNGVPVV